MPTKRPDGETQSPTPTTYSPRRPRHGAGVTRPAAALRALTLVAAGLLAIGLVVAGTGDVARSAPSAPSVENVMGSSGAPAVEVLGGSGPVDWRAVGAWPLLRSGVDGDPPLAEGGNDQPLARGDYDQLLREGYEDQLLRDIAIRDDYFEPQVVTVTVGGIARWTNLGSHVHSTTSDDGLWTATLPPTAEFSVRFLSPGVYGFHCLYHDEPGSHGQVVVLSGPAATETATPEPSPTWQIPTPEPGSGEIVFDYFANEALRDKTELFVVNGDGTGKAQLTFTSDRAEAQPSWSPDYRQVAYTTSRADRSSDPWQIAVLDRDTGQSRIITSGPDEYEPDWSPDGSRIAYTSLSGMGTSVIVSEIRTIAPDGIIARILIRMLSPSYTLMNPTYSPGGAQIAFTVGSDYSGGELYVMDSNGQNVRKIFSHDYYNDIDPAWSPDGRYIAFASGPVWGSVNNTIHSIWLVDLQSGAAGAIASVPTWDLRRPAWSPDGTEIVFNARFETDPSRYALYVVPIVGGSVRGPLSVGVEPDWGAKSLILPTPGPLPTQTPTEVTPPTPPVFPTLPTPLPTVVGPTPTNVPPPTFPPPTDEPTSTPPPTSTEPPTVELPTETATATATPEATSGIYMPVAHNGSEPTD